jgi:hypothetical protein
MKVRSFKVQPGILFDGDDTRHLGIGPDLTLEETNANQPIQLPDAKVNTDEFQKKYTFSLDGERYDPGPGWQFEVHQGLARFICAENGRYRPSRLYTPPPTTAPRPPAATLPPRPNTSAGPRARRADIGPARPGTATTSDPAAEIMRGPIETPGHGPAPGAPGNSGPPPVGLFAGVPPFSSGIASSGPVATGYVGAPPVGPVAPAPVGPVAGGVAPLGPVAPAPVGPVAGGVAPLGPAAPAPVGPVAGGAPPVGAGGSGDGAGLPAPPSGDDE